MEKIESVHHLRNVVKAIHGMKPDKQLPMMRELAKNNLFFLVFDVLGFKDLDPVLHWEMCQMWEHAGRNKLLLCPRGTFKTSVFTIGGSIYEIIRNPNIRILVSNATLTNAKAILKGMKDHFIHNEKFRTLFPEFCPPVGEKNTIREFGTQEEFRVMNQRPGIRESTVEIGSVDGNLVSRHYELHIGDDLVNHQNTTTREQINKVEFFINAAYSLLEPGVGRNVLIGTRWHFDDPYGRIIESPGQRDYLVYVRKIVEENAEGKKKSIFPSRFPLSEINRIKKKQGSRLFYSQYMNDPLPEEDQVFKAEWIKEYDMLPDDIRKRLWIVTAADPAISERIYADNTAIVTIGVDHNDDIYVLEVINGKLSPADLISALFDINGRWKPVKMGIETFAYQKALKYMLRNEMNKRKVYLPLVELATDTTKSKEVRIMGLQPRLEYSNFYIKKHGMEDLKDQLLRFPRCRHDDIIDALANTQQLIKTPGKPVDKPLFPGIRFKDFWKQHVKNRYDSQRRIGYGRLADG